MYSLGWGINIFGFLTALVVGALLIARWTPRRKYFYVRLGVWIAFLIGETFAYHPLNLIIMRACAPTSMFWTTFFVHYVLVVFMVFACYRCSFFGALFCGTAGYCMQHFTHRLSFFVTYHINSMVWSTVVLVVITSTLYFLVYYFLIRKHKYLLSDIVVENSVQVLTSALACALMIVLNSMVTAYISSRNGTAMVEAMSMLFAFVLLIFQFTMIRAKRSKSEVAMLTRMLEEKRELYERERVNMEQMNIKAHDLRHQLNNINGKVQEDVIKELEGVIDEYDEYAQTGNEPLDTIITQSHILCKKDNINFTCLINGADFTFIQPHELYALFGNAIENAINAVKNVPEEKRFISVTQATRDRFTVVRFVNYFDGNIVFDGDLPLSPKDGRYHGFGVRSIQLLAEKYGGQISVKAEGELFTLEVFLPLAAEQNG